MHNGVEQRRRARPNTETSSEAVVYGPARRFCLTSPLDDVLFPVMTAHLARNLDRALTLLSHDLAVAVPSALTGLTTVFGMGTGVALSR